MTLLIKLCTILGLGLVVHGQNKFMNAVHNATDAKNATQDNVLKAEAHKYIKDCGSSGDDAGSDMFGYGDRDFKRNENEYDGRNYRKRTGRPETMEDCDDEADSQFKDRKRPQRGHREYTKREANDFSNKSNSRGENARGSNSGFGGSNRNRNRHGANCNNDEEDGDDDEYGYGNNNRNGFNNRNNYGNNRNNANNRNRGSGRNTGGSRNTGYGNEYGNQRPSGNEYGQRGSYGGDDFFRMKRSDESLQCTSQCIFGYLEILNENRMPSESALIKFLQDKIPIHEKRIKVIRESRRCFAKISTSDFQDACDFSKSLSKCLNLDLEK